MKKFLCGLFVFVFVASMFLMAEASQKSKFSRKFIKNMKKCSSYEETTSSMYENTKFSSNKKIIGWQNGFCRYQETISSADSAYFLDCGFSQEQVKDLYEAMRDKSSEVETVIIPLYEAKKNAKTGEISYSKAGSTPVKGDRAYRLWAELQNNPYLCRPTKLQ